MKDAAQDVAGDVAGDVPQEMAEDLAFGAQAARALLATPPPPPPPSLCSSRSDGGATGQLSGIRLGLWGSATGGAAQSASMFICLARSLSRIFLGLDYHHLSPYPTHRLGPLI